MNKIKIEKYWYRYLKTLPDETNLYPVYGVMQFRDTAELANKLGELVLNGMKTATCATLWEWDAEQANPYKEIGANTMVLNGDGVPLCIIETTEILIRPFNEVDTQFAYEEGEDDRTLESWRREHWNYFVRVLPKIGKSPSQKMLIVCERFRLVFR